MVKYCQHTYDSWYITISLQGNNREGIFGAEETAHHHHQLYCRFRLKNNKIRFGLIMGIGWNLCVLNRLQCAKRLEIKMTQYVISN